MLLSKLSNEPHHRNPSDPADTLINGLCHFCWGKMRWCSNRCCLMLREVANDLLACKSLQGDTSDELAVLKRKTNELSNQLKTVQNNLDYKKAISSQLKKEVDALQELTFTMRQLVTNWVPEDLLKKMNPIVAPKLQFCEELQKQRLEMEVKVEPGDSSSSSGTGGKRLFNKPKGMKAIMAQHQKESTPATGSVLRTIENISKQRKLRAQKIKTARADCKKALKETSQPVDVRDDNGNDDGSRSKGEDEGSARPTVSQLNTHESSTTKKGYHMEHDGDN